MTDRTGDNDINKHGEPDEHDQLRTAEYDHFHDDVGADHNHRSRNEHDIATTNVHDDFRSAVIDYLAHHDNPRLHGYDDAIFLNYVRAVHDAAAAVLGTDSTATDLDALRAAYIDADALYWAHSGGDSGPRLKSARDALCAALRKKETP